MAGDGRPGVAGLLLTPGAGAGREQPALLAIDAAVAALGVTVERIDFPYRRAGRRRPDPPGVLLDAVRQSTGDLAARLGVDTSAIAIGGRSMGGRICSMAAAEGLPVAALVLVSYPLHPPGRPERPRIAHLPAVTVPCLFVSGTRDAFCTPDEMEAAAALVPGPVTKVWVEGGDHSLRRRDAEVADAVAGWLAAVGRRR